MFNGVGAMSSENGNGRSGRKFDLRERTAVFGENVIEFALTLPVNPVTRNLITQRVDAGTAVGGIYEEGAEAESTKDFRHKMALCRKEASESKYWLGMLAKAISKKRDESARLWVEAKELHLIFCRIVNTCDASLKAAQKKADSDKTKKRGNRALPAVMPPPTFDGEIEH